MRVTRPSSCVADTTTEDIAGMAVAAGVLTGTGGRTSHAAVVARELAQAVPGRLRTSSRSTSTLDGRESASAALPRETRSASMPSPGSCSPAAPGSRRSALPTSWLQWHRGLGIPSPPSRGHLQQLVRSMAAREIHIRRGRAEAEHASAGVPVKRLDRDEQALDSARREVSSLRTRVSELATTLLH